MLGSMIGSYRIVTELGSGGMGTVYFAEHTVIGRPAAIKVLRPEFASDETIVGRFLTEARAVNDIRHPNIVDVTDFGRIDAGYYIIMELLRGETLGERLGRLGKSASEASTIRIATQVASALGAAHDRGIIHRDLKPENIFLTNHPDYLDFVKVLDFGIVKLIAAPDVKRTQSGTVLGTPVYMSPEQCVGAATLDQRSDVYALGVVLYEMATGTPPFVHEAFGQVMSDHLNTAPRPLRERAPEVSRGLEAVALRALAKRPEDRFADMRALRAALADVEKPRRPSKAAISPTQVVPAARAPAPALGPVPAPAPAAVVDEPTRARNVGDKLSTIVQRRLATGTLVLPAMPGVALRCLELLRNPRENMSSLARAIEGDPLVVSQIMRIANSVALGGGRRVTSLEQAVTRLGVEQVKSVLIEAAARPLFSSRDERIRKSFRGIWEHCLAVGFIARDLAGAPVTGVGQEEAYLAGILHDVGKPVIAALLLEAERSLGEDPDMRWLTVEAWQQIIDDSHRPVGVLVARQWNLPPTVAGAIERSAEYQEAPDSRCSNLVCLSNAVAKRSGFAIGKPADDLEPLIERGQTLLGVARERLDEIVRGLPGRVRETTGVKLRAARPLPKPSS